MHHFYFGKAGTEQVCLFVGRTITVKREPAPSAKDVHQIAFGFPIACIDEWEQPGPIGAGLRTEDAQGSEPSRFLATDSPLDGDLPIPEPRFTDWIPLRRLILLRQSFWNGGDQPHRLAKSITKHSRHTQQDVNTRPPEKI